VLANFGPMMETHAGRCTIGTLVRLGKIAGVLTCAHVLEVVLAEPEFGVVCFPVRPNEVQTKRISRCSTANVAIGEPLWNERAYFKEQVIFFQKYFRTN
jgi:hypothetical protein